MATPMDARRKASASTPKAAAGKPPASSSKKLKAGRRRALADVTNSDSPISGLAPGLSAAWESPASTTISSPETPGRGEDLLRSQVALLLQQVSAESPTVPIFGVGLAARPADSLPNSPPVAPTPANTPVLFFQQQQQQSTPTLSLSRLSRSLLAVAEESALDEDSDDGGTCSSESSPLGNEEQQQEPEPEESSSKSRVDVPLRRAVSELSKITIGEPVVVGRPITALDRHITRSLDFDSLLDDMEAVQPSGGDETR